MKKFRNFEVFQTEKQGRDYIKAHRLQIYSFNQASPAWGGAWVLWYNRTHRKEKTL